MGMYIISFLDNMLLDTCLLTAVDRDPVYWKLVLTNNSEGCDYAVYIHTYIHTYFIDFPKGLFKDNT